jgi:exopolyphosphatase/guanosine-5'-triphosphate,3'-diphosphate pyrophosphatase
MAADTTDKPATAVAVIDIGSNSIRMVVAEVLGDGRIEPLEQAQRAVHLGHDTFVTGRLATQTMNAAISILVDFRHVLETYQVRHIRTVATSAVREAANSDAFLDRAYMACGLDVEVISTSEECRLTVSGVREAVASVPELSLGDAVVAEIGGGTALLTALHDGRIVASESYRLGSIRIQEALAISGESPERTADLIRHQIAGVMTGITHALPMKKVETFFAVGGDARFAARQIGKPCGCDRLVVIKPKPFARLVTACSRLSAEQLARQYDLTHAEAETLVPALLVYQGLLEETAARRIVVSDTSMRDGLLLDMARTVTGAEDEELADGVVQSATAVAEKYRCDLAHAGLVADLSVQLFDELQREHGLARRSRLLLRVAGLVHEVGSFVSGRAHHKHSYYLISNAEIFGLTGEELEVVALVARFHRRACPRRSHLEYVALPRDKRVVVSKLAALLRVADAMDRGHAQQIRRIRTERRGEELVIHVHDAADLTLERRAMTKKADLFEDIYGMTVRLEEAQLAGSG